MAEAKGEDETQGWENLMHTLMVIGVFAAMVLAPCVVASFPQLFGRATDEPETTETPAVADAAGRTNRRG